AAARVARRRKRAQRAFGRVPGHRIYVDHPRYGDQPILSDERWSEEDVRRAYWRHASATFFPETAITANIARQNYCCMPRRVYVDIEKRCRSCGRLFLWFALEQRHWFETLGFFVDADCVHCQDCRHETHLMRQTLGEYEALKAKGTRSTAEWERLETLARALYAEGYIKRPETLQEAIMPKRLRRST
ncbi:MAG: zinc-ribbon domain containing protein, partial [Pseudomonadota bacterium]